MKCFLDRTFSRVYHHNLLHVGPPKLIMSLEAALESVLNAVEVGFAYLGLPEEASVEEGSQEVRRMAAVGEARLAEHQEAAFLAEDAFPLEEPLVVAVEADDTTLYEN